MSTVTPYLIGTIENPYDQQNQGSQAPFLNNEILYDVTQVHELTGSAVGFEVKKSVDGGVNWTTVAGTTTIVSPSVNFSVAQQQVGTKLYISSIEGATKKVIFYTFDMNDEVLSAGVDTGFANTGGLSTYTVALPNGNCVIYLNYFTAGPHYFLSFIHSGNLGVTWSGEQAIEDSAVDATIPLAFNATAIGAKTLLVYSRGETGSNPSNFRIAVVTEPTTVVTTEIVADATGSYDQLFWRFTYDVGTDTVGFAYVNLVAGVETEIVIVQIVAVGTAPVTTTVVAAADVTRDSYFYPNLYVNPSGNGFIITYYHEHDPPNIIEQITSSTLTGTWSSSTLIYDLTNDPPPPPPTGRFIISLTANNNGAVVGIQKTDQFGSSRVVPYFLASGTVCPCPLGTVGGRAIRIFTTPCDPLATCSCH